MGRTPRLIRSNFHHTRKIGCWNRNYSSSKIKFYVLHTLICIHDEAHNMKQDDIFCLYICICLPAWIYICTTFLWVNIGRKYGNQLVCKTYILQKQTNKTLLIHFLWDKNYHFFVCFYEKVKCFILYDSYFPINIKNTNWNI